MAQQAQGAGLGPCSVAQTLAELCSGVIQVGQGPVSHLGLGKGFFSLGAPSLSTCIGQGGLLRLASLRHFLGNVGVQDSIPRSLTSGWMLGILLVPSGCVVSILFPAKGVGMRFFMEH